MDNHTLKKDLIFNYCAIPFLDGLEDNLVTVVTPAGIIAGTPVANDETDSNIKLIENINTQIVDKYRKELNINDENSLPGNDGFFTLKNAKLISGNVTNTFNVLNIFYDQVVAITIGSMTK